MSGLRLFLLGLPHLERDGAPLELGRHKAMALLAYLAIRDQAHRRETLATLLWPDYDHASARADLRRMLSVLNKTLGKGVLAADQGSIGLNREADLWLDVHHFHRLLADLETHGHLRDEVCPDCLPPLTKAVALYRDDFLAGFTLPDCPEFDEWQFFQTESLRQELASALEHLVHGHSIQGEFEMAIPHARRWLALDPLHEPAQRQLMQLYAWNGQVAVALRQYDECVRVLDEELGIPPETATTELYTAIKAKRIPPLPSQTDTSSPLPPSTLAPRHNLPLQSTPFIGREAELAELDMLLTKPGLRLITILGPGGIGKTRLALETAAAQLDRFSHGVYFVSLAPLGSPDAIIATVANALNFSFYEGGTPQQQLHDYLRQKNMLLVLDNLEHLLTSPEGTSSESLTKGGAELVVELLKVAPDLKILTTSRARLNVQEEQLFPITGIDFPQNDRETAGDTTHPERVAQSSAVKLFLQSARQVQPGFDLTTENSTGVAHICNLVQGMPLGILLAAAWVTLLTPAEIADEIGQSLDFLETELHDMPERQRSMRAVFDHSWRLLTTQEQTVFQQLAIFRGGFTREAAQAVTGVSLRTMITLVNKSFLHPTLGGRYEIHELLRQYGQEKLGEDRTQARAVRERHSAFYCAWLHQCQAGLSSRQQQAVLDEIKADLENVRVAWAWAVEHGRLEVFDQALESLYEFYSIRSRFQEGKELFTRAVTQLQQADVPVKHPKFEVVLTKVTARLGAFCVKLSDYEAANTHLQGSLATAAVQSDLAFALTSLGWVAAYWQGDKSLAEERLHKSLAISREIDDQKSIADTLNKLSSIASTFGQYAAGRQLAKESLVVSRQLGRPDWIAHALRTLAWATTCLGEYDEAEAYGRESLTICEEIGDQAAIAQSLNILGGVAWCKGGASLKAAGYIEKALAISREISQKAGISMNLADLALIYCELGEPAKAQQYSYEAVAIAREVGSPDRLSYELLCLGVATAGLGDFQASRNYLVEAVQIAWEARIPDHTLLALFYFATLLAKESDVAGVDEPVKSQQKARALELLALVIHHPACWQVYRDRAARVQAELEAELPPDVVATAQERGRARDLWETAEELNADL